MIYTGRASLHTSITLTLHLGRVKTAYTSCKESFFVRAQNDSFSDVHALFVARKKSLCPRISFSLIQGQKLLKFYFCGTTLIAGLRRPLNCVLTYTSPW